ncbi:DUF916 and DUF3324 domain-containing protein [Dellaglioa sp. L3N]
MNRQKRNIIFSFYYIIGALFFLISSNQTVQADQINFKVTTETNAYQLDKDVTYFDLKLNENQKTTLYVDVTNVSNKPITVEPTVRVATTNYNGVVEYQAATKTNLTQSAIPLTNLVKSRVARYQIPAKTTEKIPFNLTMPATTFEGVVAGSVQVSEKETKKAMNGQEGDTLVNNRFVFNEAIVLHGQPNTSKRTLKMAGVEAEQINARNVISLKLDNQIPEFLNQAEIEATITSHGSKKVLYQSKTAGMQIAPSSLFAYPIPLDGKALEPGTYTLHATVKSKNQKWHLVEDFRIDGQKAKKLNKKDVTIKHDYTWLYLLIAVLLIVLLLIVLITKLVRDNRKKQAEVTKYQQMLKMAREKNKK